MHLCICTNVPSQPTSFQCRPSCIQRMHADHTPYLECISPTNAVQSPVSTVFYLILRFPFPPDGADHNSKPR